jgi:hypothetical protein
VATGKVVAIRGTPLSLDVLGGGTNLMWITIDPELKARQPAIQAGDSIRLTYQGDGKRSNKALSWIKTTASEPTPPSGPVTKAPEAPDAGTSEVEPPERSGS